MNKTDLDYLKIKLKKIYGYEKFRPGQEDIIESILEKKMFLLLCQLGQENLFVINCQL